MGKQVRTLKWNSAMNSYSRVLESGAKVSLEKKRSNIKRANTRISEIAKRYGTNSDVYKQVISKFQSAGYEKYMTETTSVDKFGNKVTFARISMSLAKAETTDSFSAKTAYYEVSNVPTVSDLTKWASKKTGLTVKEIQQMKDEEKGKLFSNLYRQSYTFEDLIQRFYDVTDEITLDYEEIREKIPELYNPKGKSNKTRGQLTLEQLEQISEKLNDFIDGYNNPYLYDSEDDLDEDNTSAFSK